MNGTSSEVCQRGAAIGPWSLISAVHSGMPRSHLHAGGPTRCSLGAFPGKNPTSRPRGSVAQCVGRRRSTRERNLSMIAPPKPVLASVGSRTSSRSERTAWRHKVTAVAKFSGPMLRHTFTRVKRRTCTRLRMRGTLEWLMATGPAGVRPDVQFSSHLNRISRDLAEYHSAAALRCGREAQAQARRTAQGTGERDGRLAASS